MPIPRKSQISLDATPYYHCVSRCVRRAFLCGIDRYSNQSYEHRRDWIEQRILMLSQMFCIDICAYAVMSNHYHIVLHINQNKGLSLSINTIIERWHQLFSGNYLSQQFISGKPLDQHQLKSLEEVVEVWRERLMDISWFMRCLNEPIARKANAEDNCTGRFWEGRYKSQALLDETAILSCMAYVDLNPIRAKIAETPENSEYTSIKRRIEHIKNQANELQPTPLYPFIGTERYNMPDGIPFQLADYIELVDLTGRSIRDNKRGAIDNDLEPILNRLNINPEHWLYLAVHFESRFKKAVGSALKMKQATQFFGKQWLQGQNRCALIFPD